MHIESRIAREKKQPTTALQRLTLHTGLERQPL